MENEIMNYEDNAFEAIETAGTGMKPGVAMLVGAGITLAVGGLWKLASKGIAAFKANREQQRAASSRDFVDCDGTAE